MKRIFFFFFLVNSLFLKSQTILSDSVLGVNCYHDGSISLLITNVNSLTLNWFFQDSNLVWISADTMSSVQFLNSNLDTLLTTQCGSYRLDFNGISRYYWLPCPLGISASHDNVKCFGDSTGRLKRVAHSGAPPYNYEWFLNGIPYSSGPSDTMFDNLLVGSYKVIVTDSIGCSDSILANVVSPSVLVIDTMYSSDINCRGVNTGSISYSVSGGKRYVASEFYNYYLIDGLDTVADESSLAFSSVLSPYQATFDSLFAGEFILSVIDSFGCILDTIFEINEPVPYETYGSTIGGMLICESDSGYFKIDNVIGDSLLGSDNLGFGFLYYPNDTIYVPSGEYDIYIYDSIYSCLDTVLITCNALYKIEVYKSINHVDCFGDSTGDIVIDSIRKGNAPYDIQWGSVNNSSLFAGSYSVHIVDSIGCLKTEVFVISQANQINPNEFLYHPLCNGDANGSIAINLSGGTGGLSYYWLNGTGTADSLYGLSSGIYTLVVSDSLLCVNSFDFFLSEPDSLIISFSNFQDSLACYGEVLVLNLLISGGTAPFSVLWNDGDTNQQRIIGAGNYSCTVTDVNGCIATESFVIIEPELLSINLTYSEITCDEGATASISINGGVEPIDIIWNTGETLMSIDSLWGTIYWVVVTDSCGNSASDTFELLPYVIETSVLYYDSIHVGQVNIDTCSSTLGNFSYQWVDISGDVISNNEFSSHLCEGTYFVTTVDESTNCSVIDTLIATFDLPNGIVDIIITTVFPDSNLWGKPPYTYLWDNDDTLAHANICPPDSHWVEVIDNYGCIVREDFVIDPFYLPNGVVDTTTTVFPDSSLWGNPPYTYLWDNGEVLAHANICPGPHWVKVTDNNGCFFIDSIVIAPFDLPNGIVDITLTTVFPDSNLWGSPPYTYLWDNGDTLANATNICPGSHWVEVTDTFECMFRDDFDIDPLLITLDPAEFIIECNLENLDVIITAVATGGTKPYIYTWPNGSVGESINLSLFPGNHTVVVMDYNTCTEDTSFGIATISAECVPNVFTPNGDNINDTWNLESTF